MHHYQSYYDVIKNENNLSKKLIITFFTGYNFFVVFWKRFTIKHVIIAEKRKKFVKEQCWVLHICLPHIPVYSTHYSTRLHR